MKRFTIIVISGLLLTGCSTPAYQEVKAKNEEFKLGDYGKLKIVETVYIEGSYNRDYVDVLQDVETGCLYYMDKVDGSSLSLSPVYNRFGKVSGCEYSGGD